MPYHLKSSWQPATVTLALRVRPWSVLIWFLEGEEWLHPCSHGQLRPNNQVVTKSRPVRAWLRRLVKHNSSSNTMDRLAVCLPHWTVSYRPPIARIIEHAPEMKDISFHANKRETLYNINKVAKCCVILRVSIFALSVNLLSPRWCEHNSLFWKTSSHSKLNTWYSLSTTYHYKVWRRD